MKKHILGLAVIITLVWSSCITPPEYPNEPEITFIGFLKDTVRQAVDTNVITISFTDGDGDLGAFDTDTIFNLFLTDTRLGTVFPYRIPYIEEQGVGNGISGEIELRLLPSDNCCSSAVVTLPCQAEANAPDELVVYEVEIVDRAGNRSAPLILPAVTLYCGI
ncbi:MAG: hypothetical protein ACPG19_05915 [Saprospiraceae bacterium]